MYLVPRARLSLRLKRFHPGSFFTTLLDEGRVIVKGRVSEEVEVEDVNFAEFRGSNVADVVLVNAEVGGRDTAREETGAMADGGAAVTVLGTALVVVVDVSFLKVLFKNLEAALPTPGGG